MIFWPRETATLLKSNLHYFHREKSTFEKFDAGLKLRIVFYTHKTIKNRGKNFRVIYTLTNRFQVAMCLFSSMYTHTDKLYIYSEEKVMHVDTRIGA